MPDPDYYAETGEAVSQEDFDKAREEQKDFALEQQEKADKEAAEAENEVESPTPAADLGEGGLAATGSEDAPGPTGSPDPDALVERQENVAETGSTVTEEEVTPKDYEKSKPAAKKAAKKS